MECAASKLIVNVLKTRFPRSSEKDIQRMALSIQKRYEETRASMKQGFSS